MDRSNAKEIQEHSLLYSNLSNVQALEWSNDQVLCITRQANGSYQLYRFYFEERVERDDDVKASSFFI